MERNYARRVLAAHFSTEYNQRIQRLLNKTAQPRGSDPLLDFISSPRHATDMSGLNRCENRRPEPALRDSDFPSRGIAASSAKAMRYVVTYDFFSHVPVQKNARRTAGGTGG
jgi:hypothetical protein